MAPDAVVAGFTYNVETTLVIRRCQEEAKARNFPDEIRQINVTDFARLGHRFDARQ